MNTTADTLRSLQRNQIVKITTRNGSRRSVTRYGEVRHVEQYGTSGVLVQFSRQMKAHPEYGFVGLNRSMVITAHETIAVEVVG